MEIFLFWLLFSIVVGAVASSRGRSGFGWFLLAMLISPLLAIIFVALAPSRAKPAGAPTPATHVKCPDCAELVLREAKVCKHCGCRLVPQPLEQAASAGPYSDLLVAPDGQVPDGFMKCGGCGGLVRRDARACRHCHAVFDRKPEAARQT